VIESVEAKDFGCLKDVSFKLTPLHAFIGPNDSGKSTLLRAASKGVIQQFEADEWGSVTADLTGGYQFLQRRFRGEGHSSTAYYQRDQSLNQWPEALRKQMAGFRLCRFDPDDLRRPSPLIPDSKPLTLGERGQNLPSVYDAILNRGDDSFRDIAAKVRAHFPTIKNLRLKAVSQQDKTFEVDLVDGSKVGAERFSEGLLYYLAFAALPYLKPVSLLLIEEPENGLHPSRIAEVMKVLRAISEGGTQVLIATHSPLVVNELKPEEVSIVTRTAKEGTKVTRMIDTPNFAQRSKVYALGELWLSYANGEDERDLLTASTQP